MNGFQRSNKRAGVYWLKKSIRELQVGIKLQQKNNIVVNLNPTETSNHPTAQSQQYHQDDIQEHTFKWQEKVFSKWELLQYTDSFNCSTETEMNYHNLITNHNIQPNIISTQINEDIHHNFSLKGSKKENIVDSLSFYLDRLNLNCGMNRMLNAESMGHLLKSEENVSDNDLWMSMNIMLDCSDYREDQLLLKREEILVTLHYNPEHHCLIVTPDRNDLETNPYSISFSSAAPVKYDYAVGFEMGLGERSDGLVELLTKLQNKWSKKHKPLLNFTMPPLGKIQTTLSLELVSATGFEMDNLYIEYNIKTPEGVLCEDPLHGRTHTTASLSVDGQDQWLFGHPIELCFTTDAAISTPPIKIILEVISTDWWESHRTEGYTCTSLPLDPGHGTMDMACMRPEEKNKVEADTRRFFVAGCNLLQDLDVLCEPTNQEPNIRFVTTGSVTLRWSSMTQCHEPRVSAPTFHAGSSYSSSALLKSAEAVLTQYRKAKARLHAATGDSNGDAD